MFYHKDILLKYRNKFYNVLLYLYLNWYPVLSFLSSERNNPYYLVLSIHDGKIILRYSSKNGFDEHTSDF